MRKPWIKAAPDAVQCSVSVDRFSTDRDLEPAIVLDAACQRTPWGRRGWNVFLDMPCVGGWVALPRDSDHRGVVGFCMYSLYNVTYPLKIKEYFGLDWGDVVVFSMTVRSEPRWSDAGRMLIDALRVSCPITISGNVVAKKASRVIIPVHEENLEQQLMLKSMGIPVVGTVRKYYPDERDCYIFRAERGRSSHAVFNQI